MDSRKAVNNKRFWPMPTDLTISRKQRLRTLENEIRSGMEEFYYTGMKLKEIRDDELYKEDGFKTWEQYLGKQWELSYRYVANIITSAEYRQKLPTCSTGAGEWTERSVRELKRIPKKADAARVAQKIIDQIDKAPELKLTSTLVRKFVDEDLGVKRKKPKAEPKDNGIDLLQHIRDTTGEISGIRAALETHLSDKEAWRLLIKNNPGTVKRLIEECTLLADFLRRMSE
jgi:hypothetical protein